MDRLFSRKRNHRHCEPAGVAIQNLVFRDTYKICGIMTTNDRILDYLHS